MALDRVAYRPSSWIDPRVEERPSPIHGRGLFATMSTGAGERVMVWGGEVTGLWRKGYVAIGEGRYLGGSPDDTDLLNHSCDPNLWMRDEVTLIARRQIPTGEELTADYALWEADEHWAAPWPCRCGAANCRCRVTGRDWRSPELQRRYPGRFSPFLNERIESLRRDA